MLRWIEEFWPELIGAVAVVIAIVLTTSVVLNKRNERAAVGWVGVIWLNPFIGAIIYLLFGINRIKRRAIDLRPDRNLRQAPPSAMERLPKVTANPPAKSATAIQLSSECLNRSPRPSALPKISRKISRNPTETPMAQ